MGKIVVLVLFGLALIGVLGWGLGHQPSRSPHFDYSTPPPDSRFTTSVPASRLRLEAETLAQWMQQGSPAILLVDTRSAKEFEANRLKHAIHRDPEALLSLQSLRRLPRHRLIILYGDNEPVIARTVKVMRQTGLVVFYLDTDSRIVDSLPVSDQPTAIAEIDAEQGPKRPAISLRRGDQDPPIGRYESGESGDLVQLGLLAD